MLCFLTVNNYTTHDNVLIHIRKEIQKMKVKKRHLFVVVGRTGSGKDTLVQNCIRKQFCNGETMKGIVSYTTRPKRVSEIEGREHHFITEQEADEQLKDTKLLAYTKIGKYRYFAKMDQIQPLTLYVIDPDGIEWMLDHSELPEDVEFHVFYIWVPKWIRKRRYIKRVMNAGTLYTKEELAQSFEERNHAEDRQFRRFEKTGAWHYKIRNIFGKKRNIIRFRKLINFRLKVTGIV